MAKWSDFPDATSEAIRLREENAKLREVNAEQAKEIEKLQRIIKVLQEDLREADKEILGWVDSLREER